MLDIFCHKITFIFQDTQVDVSDLIDIGKELSTPMTKQQLVDRLTAVLDRRRNKHERNQIVKENARESHKKDRPI